MFPPDPALLLRSSVPFICSADSIDARDPRMRVRRPDDIEQTRILAPPNRLADALRRVCSREVRDDIDPQSRLLSVELSYSGARQQRAKRLAQLRGSRAEPQVRIQSPPAESPTNSRRECNAVRLNLSKRA
jgi:hypothetical protein